MVDGIALRKNYNSCTVYTIEEVGARRHLINHVKKMIVVADNSKFNKPAHYQYCRFSEVDLFITNNLAKDQIQQCKKIIEL